MSARYQEPLPPQTARCPRCVELERENEQLRRQLAELHDQLGESQRAGKRQSAPFSKGAPKEQPRRPGRRSGEGYGKRAHRPIPERVDEVLDAPLPSCCPYCQGEIEPTEVRHQYQTDIPPVTPKTTRFDVGVGRCVRCQRRIQGRHPQQRSDALGAAGSVIGPQAMALAADCNKSLGLSYGKVMGLFRAVFGLAITRGGISGMVARTAQAAGPTYQALTVWIRKAAVVSPDETGWRVGGYSAWLWAFVAVEITVFAVRPGRGFAEAAEILGEDFGGTLVRDGWCSYLGFEQASHQTCIAHILRRTHHRLEVALAGAARVPHAVRAIFKDALVLRDRRDHGEISAHGLRVALGKIRARMDRLLCWQATDPDNAKLLAHLRREREHDALFTFVLDPEVPATNFWSEQAIRPAVVNRKVWGGNRTWIGAHTQEVLTSVLRTARQQGHDALALLVDLLTRPVPTVAARLQPSWLDPPPQ
jgi:transposase